MFTCKLSLNADCGKTFGCGKTELLFLLSITRFYSKGSCSSSLLVTGMNICFDLLLFKKSDLPPIMFIEHDAE